MVEIIPKEIEEVASWQRILFYSLVVVIIALIAFYFMLFFNHREAEEKLHELDGKLEEIQKPEKLELESKVVGYKQKIDEVNPYVDNHIVTSKAFVLLEDLTHPQVFFRETYIHPLDDEVKLSGVTNSFISLGQQLNILQEDDSVREVKLSSVSINDKNEIEFGLGVYLDKEVFKY